MGGIRPLTPDDVRAVAALRRRAFRATAQPTEDALVEYLERVFIENPWQGGRIRSMVYEEDGEVVGFQGVVPRPMIFEGEPIEAAVATQLMVAPERRGIVGVKLFRACLRAPYDLVLADVANEPARRLWTGLGGRTVPLYSFFWTRPLRPLRHALGRLGSSPTARLARLAARPVVMLADGLARRSAAGGERRGVDGTREEPFDPAAVARLAPEVLGAFALRPAYDAWTVEWLGRRVREKAPGDGAAVGAIVRDAGDEPVGWYLFVSNPGGVGQVVQTAALPRRMDAVLDALLDRAWREGNVALAGRFDGTVAEDLRTRGCTFRYGPPWFLVHSRRPEIIAAIDRGDAFLSRLEGEWWMNF